MLGTASHLRAGELEAVFLPELGMLGASLRHRGEELLGRVDDLEAAAAKGSTGGIPLLHPWANRLSERVYGAAGQTVELDTGSAAGRPPGRSAGGGVAGPLLHLDGNGLAIHGVPWSRLTWQFVTAREDSIAAALDFSSPELLEIFPFPHRLAQEVRLDGAGLTISTTLTATGDTAVPVSFGYHPYFTLPGAPRGEWRVELPAMRRFLLDGLSIPTGEGEQFEGLAGPLDRDYDDGFSGLPHNPVFALEGGGRRLEVSFLEGYPYAQVFAPPGTDFVCIEPMTAPTNALVSGAGLRFVEPGASFKASFRIAVAG